MFAKFHQNWTNRPRDIEDQNRQKDLQTKLKQNRQAPQLVSSIIVGIRNEFKSPRTSTTHKTNLQQS